MADSKMNHNSDGSFSCPVCGVAAEDLATLSSHLVELAGASDGHHVMWLNRNVTKQRVSAEELERLLAALLFEGGTSSDKVKR